MTFNSDELWCGVVSLVADMGATARVHNKPHLIAKVSHIRFLVDD